MTDTSTTTPEPRQAGLRGLLPIDHELHAQLPTLEAVAFTLPAPTYPIDKTAGLTDWGMGGNGPDPTLTVNNGNPVGDCGPCAVPYHADVLTTALLKVAETTGWTTDKIVTLYLRYTNGQDVGVDLGAWLLWLYQQEMIAGFVKLTLDQMDAALDFFDVVVTGVDLNPQADQQFENHQPWTDGPGDEPDPGSGHAILYVKAESADGEKAWVTWGGVQLSTEQWRKDSVQQAFGVLTKEQAAAKDFPYAEVEAILEGLGGTGTKANVPPANADGPNPEGPEEENDGEDPLAQDPEPEAQDWDNAPGDWQPTTGPIYGERTRVIVRDWNDNIVYDGEDPESLPPLTDADIAAGRVYTHEVIPS